MLDKSNYRGIFVIVVTPFPQDFELDEHAASPGNGVFAAGVHGVVANALASEGGYLSECERRRAAEIVIGATSGRYQL